MRQNPEEHDRAQVPETHRVPVSGGGWLWAEHCGTGSPVALLHGAGMDARLWDLTVPALARHHRVVRFDARGLGRSTPPEGPFDDVEDLLAVLDYLGLRQAALATRGHRTLNRRPTPQPVASGTPHGWPNWNCRSGRPSASPPRAES